jgi:hypothetical protein
LAPDLSQYAPDHRLELEQLLASPDWVETLRSGLVEEVRKGRIEPGKTIDYVSTVVDQLLAVNEARVTALIADSVEDGVRLFRELSTWPADLGGKPPVQSFLGLNVTAECNFEPKCVYCNQPWVESSVGLDGWKRVIEEITESNGGEGPYIYITGGEPLVLGEEIWGDDGLVRFATERNAAVNVNTNATMITPEIALRMIKAGMSKLHISLDTADRETQDDLLGGERYDQVLRGIYTIQLARDIVGVTYPEIHTNCVLTNKNMDAFPDLFTFITQKRKRLLDRGKPLYFDLFPHIIPVGGDGNVGIRPTLSEFKRFFGEIWPEVAVRWNQYQAELGVDEEKRSKLFGYFLNPFERVDHEGGLDAYVQAAADGRYGRLALSEACYVAPTQASFTPDGRQFRCGSHAIRRILPIGNVSEGGVFENIRSGVPELDGLPTEDNCYGCALATLYINQAVESKLHEELERLKGSD